jgi:hypothetical protein
MILPFLTRKSGWREHNDKHYIFDTITMIIDPQIFVDCAFAMFNGGDADRNESASALTRMRRFRSHFGTTPRMCAIIWEHLKSNGAAFRSIACITQLSIQYGERLVDIDYDDAEYNLLMNINSFDAKIGISI